MFYCKVSETVVDSRQKKNPRKHANRQKVQAEGKILKIGRWVLETSENRIHDTWSKTDKAWGRQRKQKNPGSVWPLCFAFFSQVLYFSPPLFMSCYAFCTETKWPPSNCFDSLAWLTSWPHATSSAHPHSSHIMLCWDATESAVSVVTHLLRKK